MRTRRSYGPLQGRCPCRLPIKELVASPLMDELLVTVQQLEGHGVSGDGAGAAPQAAGGWFAPANALRLRRGFAELDTDGDGLLSPDDFAHFGDGTLTTFFVRHLFAQHCSSGGGGGGGGGGSNAGGGGRTGVGPQMDFAGFAAFVAAWEERGSPGAVRYFFPLLDLQGRGYIDQVGGA